MRQSVVLFVAVTVGLGFSVLPEGAHADSKPTADEIMLKVENRNQGKDLTAKATLEVIPKEGTKRLRQFQLVRKKYDDATKLVTFFLAPADVRGAAFLSFDRIGADDLRWLYLPAIGQVRQLASESDRQSFFGSDYVYEDFTNRDPDKDDHKLVGSQKVDEWDCWVVDSTPKNARGLDFAKYRTWVWKAADMVVRQEFFDGNNTVVRRGQLQSAQKVQDIWTWHRGTMTNLRTSSQSKLEISDVHYNTDVPDERFSESQLSRGLPK